MSKIRVCLVGSTGRMGKEISALLKEETTMSLAAEVNRERPLSEVNTKDIDVIIDFSLPESAEKSLEWAQKNKKPIVSGITGITPSQIEAYQKSAKTIPVLWSPNMSLGIAVMNSIIKKLPQLSGFDVQLEEVHHTKKKDKPSGTALYLQSSLENKFGSKIPEPLSVRGGGVFGVHKLYIMGQEETLTIEHTALTRALFARGALAAAKWLVTQRPGYYNMSNVLGEE